MKGTLVIDVTIIPKELDLAAFFILLKQEGVCFYDSRQNPDALPPYGVNGEITDVSLLDIEDDKVRAMFELALLNIKEEESEKNPENKEDSNSENEDIQSS